MSARPEPARRDTLIGARPPHLSMGIRSGSGASGPRAVRRIVDIATPPAATLRVALVDDGDAGEVLILCHGFGSGDDFRRPAWAGTPIRLPAQTLPELRAALEQLG